MALFDRLFDFGQKARIRLYTLLLSRSFASLGEGSRIVPPLRWGNLHQISVGRDVYVSQGCWIQVVPGAARDVASVIRIGDCVKIGMDVTITAVKGIVIEDYAMMARNVFISDHGHEFHSADRPIAEQGIRRIAEVRIGHGAWIGHGAVILPGVSVGRNAVVGANSVVRSDVPDYSVVAGSPARLIERYDFEEERWTKVEAR